MQRTRDLGPADAAAVTDLYRDYEWWADRDVEAVRKALAETPLAVGVEVERAETERPEAGRWRLVASARVLTDRTYYATVYDVIVAADRRGEGHGRRLLEAVLDHPELEDLPRISLLAREGLVPFYESVGFERFDPTVTIPEGDEGETETLIRMVWEPES